ncbi:M23 family metallopeptidase [Kitasatospora terrestris]|uniref:M23 family metallopeptidase n=1 Tax=Kitasatospora terrestris TaxID=258051 RepID=UPI0031E82B97
MSSGGVGSPVPGHGVTTGYGIPGSWQAGHHTGADYAADEGATCVAVLDGVVSETGFDADGYGNYLVLRSDGSDFWYCHLSSRGVTSGEGVGAGQTLARVGHTGNATGPHLHFEKRPAGGGYGSDVPPVW